MDENLTLMYGVGQETSNGQQTILDEFSNIDEALNLVDNLVAANSATNISRFYISFLYKNTDNETVRDDIFSGIDV